MQSQEIKSLLQSSGTTDTESIENYVSMFMNMDTYRTGISLVNTDGTILYSTDDSLTGTSISDETYFQNSLASGTSSQSNVFTSDSESTPSVTYIIPFHNMEFGQGPEGMQHDGNATAVPSSELKTENAKDINKALESIHGGINLLKDELKNISTSVGEINNMVEDSSAGVSDVAARDTDIVSLTSDTRKMVESNRLNATELDTVVKSFKLY